MSMKREERQEIVNYLCGEEGLKDEFIDLLKLGGLSEYEGNIIKDALLEKIDSDENLVNEFYFQYLNLYFIYHKLTDDKELSALREDETIDYRICEDEWDYFSYSQFPERRIDEYIKNKGHLGFDLNQYPKTVDEAVNRLIEVLDKESIVYAKETKKFEFGIVADFSLGLYARNNFGLWGRSIDLLIDIKRNGGDTFTGDGASSFLLDKVWERIQEDYDEIIKTKE